MKHLKAVSILMFVAMCMTMVMTPVTADESTLPEQTQLTDESEDQETAPSNEDEKDPYTIKGHLPEEQAQSEAEYAYLAKGKCGKKVKWTLSKKGTLKITGKGAMKNYSYNQKTSKTNVPWFKYLSKIKKVVISKGVTKVGNYAFFQGTKIKSLSLPKSLKSIGDFAFWNCCSLVKVSIPKKVRNLGQGAFGYCGKLAKVNIPSGITAIKDNTFYGCCFKSIGIPKSVKGIGKNAFFACMNLKSITIPASVKTIGEYAFFNCGSLQTVNIPLSGAVSIGESAFAFCSSLKKFKVPLSVTSLSNEAFGYCTGLEEITISENLYNANKNAFAGCSNLRNKDFYKWADPGEEFFHGVFKYVITNPDIDGKGTVSVIEMSATEEKINIPSTVPYKNQIYKVNRIEPCRFVIGKLKYLVLGSNVTSIADKALANCPELESVTGGAKLTTIGANAFENCPKLKVFNISSKTLKKIGGSAFEGDTALTTLFIRNTTKLTKAGVKNSLKGSSVKVVKVKKNKVKKYKKFFKTGNCGKKVTVRK